MQAAEFVLRERAHESDSTETASDSVRASVNNFMRLALSRIPCSEKVGSVTLSGGAGCRGGTRVWLDGGMHVHRRGDSVAIAGANGGHRG
jgi:hypothetical protein|eukprot:COSAG01_NODE_20205_length_965_cov_2.512702_2_plen_90_part_00